MKPGERRQWRLASRLDALAGLRSEVRDLAMAHGFADGAADDLALCVHEAVSNAIVHGNRGDERERVEVDIVPQDSGLRVRVRNAGPGFDAERLRAEADAGDRPRGRGMRIISSLTSEFDWRDDGRELTFLKRP